MAGSIVFDKSKAFAVRIVRMSHYIRTTQNERVISSQICRSGTSIGANISEALSAISYKEFQSKMYIALKECRETMYWLQLLKDTNTITTPQFDSTISDCSEIFSMLTAITRTTSKKLNQSKK